MASAYHAEGKEELFDAFAVTPALGLTQTEARHRLETNGQNQLKRSGYAFGLGAFFKQFINPLVFVLIIALLATLYLGEHVDALVIALALVVNVIIGFIQERRASKAFEALVDAQEVPVLALREGRKVLVENTSLVPGDIVFLESGGVVPADCYIISAFDLSVSEAHLTGESEARAKRPGVVPLTTPVYERTNIAYMGSPILSGSAKGLVIATGAQAEVGSIAESLSTYTSAKTPVEISVEHLARFLAIIVIAVVLILLAVGAFRGLPFSDTLLLGVALAVSVVPEGLPAAVTAILAIGMEHILKKRGLVRNLLAAETLGSTTVILTDKTGTLTEARMQLTDIVTAYSSRTDPKLLEADQTTLLTHALHASDVALLSPQEEGSEPHFYGRPLESAIARFALDACVFDAAMKIVPERIDFLNFASARRFAASLYPNTEDEKHSATMYASGAPETLLAHAGYYLGGGEKKKLTKEMQHAFEEKLHRFAEEGKRVVAVLSKNTTLDHLERKHDGAMLDGGVFEGLIVFSDPVRADVPRAIQEVKNAGVRVVMVTGDTAPTARTIAREAGILEEDETVVLGSDVEKMNDAELHGALMRSHVFARILPQQKQRLVSVLAERGEVVGMTGDGVNDAPALKAATIGVAVGSGTEVAREAADLVLLDDSFSIITAAIREGRRILDNLKKAVTHLVATSFHEVFIISVAILAGLPLPILPVQILWVNMLEEGFLTFAFAFEPAEPGVMRRSPRSNALRTVLTGQVQALILIAGLITSAFSVTLYLWLLSRGLPIEEIRTIMFVVLSLDALLFAISLKNLHQPFWTVPLFNNRYLVFALSLSLIGLIATLEIEPIRNLLSLAAPSAFDFAVLLGVAVVNVITIEFAKKIAFRRNAKIAT